MDRVKHGTLRSTCIGNRCSIDGPIIDPLAAEWRSCFSQMNAYLMGSTRFEPALDERVTAEIFEKLHMSDGTLTGIHRTSASSPVVSPIGDQT